MQYIKGTKLMAYGPNPDLLSGVVGPKAPEVENVIK